MLIDHSILVWVFLLILFPSGCAIENPTSPSNPIWDHPLTEKPQTGMILRTQPTKRLNSSKAYDYLSEADVVLAGEKHNHPGSHQVQFETLEKLHERDDSLAIGFEFFRVPQQDLIDAWSGNAINFRTLKEQLDLSKSGKDLLESYRVILQYAKKNDIPIRALKPSRKSVNEVREHSRESFDTMTTKTFKSSVNSQQKAFLRSQFKKHVPTERGFETFLAVQHFWEERMAANIDTFLRNPDTPDRMLVLTGNYHAAYDFGLASKLEQHSPRSVRSVITLPKDRNLKKFFDYPGLNSNDPPGLADLIWWVEPVRKSP